MEGIDFLKDIFVRIIESPTFVSLAESDAVSLVKKLLAMLLVLAVGVIVYVLPRMYEINKREYKKYSFVPPPSRAGKRSKSPRWDKVLEHLATDNQSEWKFAVIEADNILFEMVRTMGYDGDTLGEMLKNVEPSDFTTLQSAWEAHKIRNLIAHESSQFELSKREARRVIKLFEAVFKEFDYI